MACVPLLPLLSPFLLLLCLSVTDTEQGKSPVTGKTGDREGIVGEPGHVDPGKCELTQLEEDMAAFNAIYKKGENKHFPTLKELRKKYPEDEEFLPPVSEPVCEDARLHWSTPPREMCSKPARAGMCTGTYIEIERERRQGFEEGHEDKMRAETGFHQRRLEDIHPNQIGHMQVMCRQECRELLGNLSRSREDIRGLREVEAAGGYGDIMYETFGEPMEICNLAKGFHYPARDRAIGIHTTNYYQPKVVPRFHPIGFQKVKIPTEIYSRILSNRKKLNNQKKKFRIENCDLGMQNCHRLLESRKSMECHVVSAENYFYRRLEGSLLMDIYSELRLAAQEWIGNKVELAGTSIYGIRRYTRGAWLLSHLDHLETHVISAILNIKQDVEEDWPLQILDHQGQPHEVILKAGEMVWYESASLVHGRVKPLKGKYFENVFVHYMPSSRLWYKSDFDFIRHGDPVMNITLEALMEDDKKIFKKRREEEKMQEQEKEELERKLDAMTEDQRLQYVMRNKDY